MTEGRGLHAAILAALRSALLLVLSARVGMAAQGAPAPVRLGDLNAAPPSRLSGFSYSAPALLTALGERLLFTTAARWPESPCLLWSYTPRTGAVRPLASPEAEPISGACFSGAWVLGARALVLTGAGELWRTDGTPAGTAPLLLLGLQIQSFGNGVVKDAGGTARLVFSGCDRVLLCGLWTTDGTAEGTERLRGDRSGWLSVPGAMIPWRGRLYFQTSSFRQGAGLWSTDGTGHGTTFLGKATSLEESSVAPVVAGEHLYFASFGLEEELWVTDGTPESTRKVRSFAASPCRHDCEADLSSLHSAGREVVFPANDGVHGIELWASDGSAGGTHRLTDLPDPFVAVAETLRRTGGGWVFLAYSPSPEGFSSTLWRTQGEPATTTRVQDSDCAGGCPEALVAVDRRLQPEGWLVFLGLDSEHGRELWSSDGTGVGTRRLADVCPGPCSAFGESSYPLYSVVLGGEAVGKLFFTPSPEIEPETDGTQRKETWSTDGTPEGTERLLGEPLSEIAPFAGQLLGGTAGGDPPALRLWSTDGTVGGTVLRATVLADREQSDGSSPVFFSAGHGALFVSDDRQGENLYRTDGTPQGTVPIPGAAGGLGRWTEGARCGRWTYLIGALPLEGGTSATELWRSDGSPGSTQLLLRTSPGEWVDLSVAVDWQGRCLFQIASETGRAFWVSDGSPGGTRRLFRLPPEVDGPLGVLGFGARFLFVANVPARRGKLPQLFVSTGTREGTRQLTDLTGEREQTSEYLLQRVGSRVFVRIPGPSFGTGELWVTDGTELGTHRLLSELVNPQELTAFRGTLLFRDLLPDGTGCAQGLYRWTPGEAVPLLLAELRADPRRCWQADRSLDLTLAGDRFYFVGGEEKVRELWRSDGTPEGTKKVGGPSGGPEPSAPSLLVAASGRIYFTAFDLPHGRELWTSDGTAEGTRLVADLFPGLRSSNVENLNHEIPVAAGKLYFSADDGVHGEEPWALEVEP